MESTIRKRTNLENNSGKKRSSSEPSDGTPNILPTPESTAAKLERQSQVQQMPRVKPLLLFVTLCSILYILFRRQAAQKETVIAPLYDDNIDRESINFSADPEKRAAIVASFKHAWNAYRHDAWGFDDYHPIARKGGNLSPEGGIGYTIVDALDSLWIMGLKEEFAEARQWVAKDLTFNRHGKFNTFEITIRVLGGLLSAYHLSHDAIFLEKSIDLAERIMPVFLTASGIPLSFVDLAERKGIPDTDNRGMSSTAEAATLQLEFKYLSYLTDDYVYWNAVEKVMNVIRVAGTDSGLVPIFMRSEDGTFVASEIRFGSRGDSYYEYLLKQYLQTNREEPMYREMYDEAMDAMHKEVVKRTKANNLLYIAELVPKANHQTRFYDWEVSPKQDHLVCFLGGSLLLGVTEGQGPFPPKWSGLATGQRRDWNTGTELIKTCMATHNTVTGLSPEIAHFKKPEDENANTIDWYIKGLDNPNSSSFDARYILRPETVESLFLAWRQTGDPKYREQGWKIYQAIEKYCKVKGGGYVSILNVNSTNPEKEDKMETFFLSETLKYLYLLFSESSLIPLDKYVFNTEAHPLPIFKPIRNSKS